ncbi:MAG: aminotransferase class III-fold pyridoxal phosphate-dependent enzyme [Gammaproteobacteria bacterium]|nr:aminotransferase class III-fold pyridoxal phosphate-dependent enzyme [Gammaproteobacteria bacterium]
MIRPAAVDALLAREQRDFIARHPRSAALAADAGRHWPGGVPLHWMADWGTPFPLSVAEASGATLVDVDGHVITDFCLGDTGAMFGHSPPAVAAAIAAQAARGLTCMLPDARVAAVGAALAGRFGLPYWQAAQTASDANRAALRWARALTGRPKVLVFHGCYHGLVEETMVRLRGGRTVPREGAVGSAFDHASAALAVEFNDVDALERALAGGEVAAVIAEPVMTNCGMVLPEPGFDAALRALTRRYGALLVVDETHTLSSGPGGYAGEHALEPDLWVCGKAIAGGLPCAVWGMSAEVEARRAAWLARRDAAAATAMPDAAQAHGHSGMGTTLAGNALAIAALEAALAHLHTDATHAAMRAGATRIEQALRAAFAARGLDWHVSRVGARLEFGFGPAPRNGSEAEAQDRPLLGQALRLWLLNRGLLMTPFHQMLLAAPTLAPSAADALCASVAEFLDEVSA